MNMDNFLMCKHRRAVEEFSERTRWDELSPKDQERIGEELADLPNGLDREGYEARI
jgi:type I restriction enzyme R subunit